MGLLAHNVTEPAKSKRALPIVFKLNKICNIQSCVDYWKLKAETIQASFLTPRVNEGIDSLRKATIFSALDAKCGYLQGEIEETGRGKTACMSYSELY